MARLTRQQLKQDEFATQLAGIREFSLQNQRTIVIAALAIVAAVAVIVGGYLYVSSRQTRASEALADALAVFHAPVMATPPANAAGPTFKSDSEKYQQAYKLFSDVADRYSWYAQGKFARYYAALCERELGKFPEAQKDLNAIAEGGDKDLAALAKLSLAGVDKQTGRNDEAEKLLKDLEDHPTDTVPKATVELELADLYQKTKPAEAAVLYKKIQTEFPGMAAGDLASKMLLGPPR